MEIFFTQDHVGRDITPYANIIRFENQQDFHAYLKELAPTPGANPLKPKNGDFEEPWKILDHIPTLEDVVPFTLAQVVATNPDGGLEQHVRPIVPVKILTV